jgi:hypothetical protein
MKRPCYINSFASIHPNGIAGDDGILHAVEPDYKHIITNANMRRRMSHIVRMGVACGLTCLEQNEDKNIDAIITATGLGCLADTEKFLDNLIENEEQLLNPSAFIQSTFNVIGAQIALLTGNRSYNNTYVHRGLSFESALIDGVMKIWEGGNRVLVGAVDEVLPAEHSILKRLGMLDNITLGEGSQFFTLAAGKQLQTVAELVDVKTFTGRLPSEKILQKIKKYLNENDLEPGSVQYLITGRNGNTSGDSVYNDVGQLFPFASYSTFKDICGEYPTASAFAMWKGINLLKESDDKQYLLIYNHYYNINHSLILLKKC